MGCGASYHRPFERGWTIDPLSSPQERAEQRREWEAKVAREEALRKRLAADREAYALSVLADAGAAPNEDPLKDYRGLPGAFAWAPASSSGPTTVAGIWLSGSGPEHGSKQLATGRPPSADCWAVRKFAADKPAPGDDPEQIWNENTPGRLRFWAGTELETQWVDLGDKLARTESLEEYNRRIVQNIVTEIAEIDSAINSLATAVADLEQKIPALERDRKLQKAARNFREVGQIREEITEATATLADKRAELETQKTAKATKEAERAARMKPPVETRIVARFRSPAVDT